MKLLHPFKARSVTFLFDKGKGVLFIVLLELCVVVYFDFWIFH